MENNQPLILVTNDDGMFAPGIKALVQVAKEFGEVVVVAPNSPQSAKGHAVTLHDPIRINKVDVFEGIKAYECTGTPVDCVKLAKFKVLHDRQIDLCLSGINHGSNASVNIIYSGTMSAAMEASLDQIPSIGFSLLNYSFDADFGPSKVIVRKIVQAILEKKLQETKLLNVNIPDVSLDKIRGVKVCRQADGRWVEEFQEGEDPRGQKYYWLTGRFIMDDVKDGTDIHALNKNYVSVVPSGHDLTIYPAIEANAYLEKIRL